MNKFILVIFGNMEFIDDVATVHSIYHTILVPSNKEEDAMDIAENERKKNGYDSYLMPQFYAGEIIWKN